MDGLSGNDEQAKDLADAINNGVQIAAGVIDLSNPVILYSRGLISPSLAHARPNPMSRTTAIEFDVPKAGPVTVAIYDVRGRLVRILLAVRLDAGRKQVHWDCSDESGRRLESGIYFYRVESGRTG